ncbi:O-antigen ligase family protein [Polynucleobacter sp. MWH-Braz-FAM2G]|uniref:O-antigen ligase family protein n=1 Tax=Polynucleobacter sp. MWH-Braz-FAM2G TaxID=1855883 RepID=UPI001BFD623F|nr:O-antigen ligase family protein [Polynucleobacter sp. MWH-Braz-FAM2G]QWD91076.1 O-antigen ligase family protein [Polynucleobacter sp. MWH-Braz-FAM2G]
MWKKYKELSPNAIHIVDLFSSPTIKSLMLSLGVVSLCFFIATLAQPSGTKGLYDLLTIYIGPITLGILAFIVFPKKIESIEFLNLACAASVIFLGFTDIFHYGRELYQQGTFGHPYTHRWFSDGYLFFMPWLLMRFFSNNRDLKKLGWFFLITMILILLLATGGSRGSMVVVISQILIFVCLYSNKRSFFFGAALLLMMLGIGFWGALQLAPKAISISLEKGLFVGDRMNDAWLPVLDFIRHDFWIGHGFGRAVWDQAYAIFLTQHERWPGINWGGPHNQVLDVAFIGGVFAVIAYCVACFLIVKILFTLARRSSPEIAGAALATLCSFVGLYLVRGLVESIRWEPLGIILTWCLYLSYLNQNQSAEE